MSKNLQKTNTSFKSILDKLDIDETLTSLLVCDYCSHVDVVGTEN